MSKKTRRPFFIGATEGIALMNKNLVTRDVQLATYLYTHDCTLISVAPVPGQLRRSEFTFSQPQDGLLAHWQAEASAEYRRIFGCYHELIRLSKISNGAGIEVQR